jgi:hypothetical protein
MELIALYVSSFFLKLFFSKSKKELPLVALFSQEKIQFYKKRLSTSITAST